MKQLIECVPNISEGRNPQVYNAIAESVETVDGIKLLDVDPGYATNRTVITFVGDPKQVVEAALVLIKKSYELIDMSKHTGEHPRFGATDVCPLVPIANIEMEEVVKYAHQLGERIGKELNLNGYFYENAATNNERKNLAIVRAGEYEGLSKKLTDANWQPDFGPPDFNEKFGCVAVGARDFLIAYNANLNTSSTRRANSVAFDVREKGRIKRKGNTITGEIVKDENGDPVWEPGLLKCVKGIAWFIEEYGIAQVSMNLTNISVTSMHEAFEACRESANKRGLRVTGSELVGLIPKKAMLEAGKFYLKKQNRSVGVSESELIDIAIKSLGLNDLAPFNPKEKIIEYVLEDTSSKPLINMRLNTFADTTASESPAPGGGSISAYVGALGAALGAMVGNLSSHKRGWDDKVEQYGTLAEKAQQVKKELLDLVDEDTAAFNNLMTAFRLKKSSEEEITARKEAIEAATKTATEVPFTVMQKTLQVMDTLKTLAETGLKSSISDVGVAALCARTAIMGAFLNVKINAKDLEDQKWANQKISSGKKIEQKALDLENEILQIVEDNI